MAKSCRFEAIVLLAGAEEYRASCAGFLCVLPVYPLLTVSLVLLRLVFAGLMRQLFLSVGWRLFGRMVRSQGIIGMQI